MSRLWPAVWAGCLAALTLVGVSSAHPGQHPGSGGHLPASSANVTLVGKAFVHDAAEGIIADVGVYGNYAYLAEFYGDFAACQASEGDHVPDGGLYVIVDEVLQGRDPDAEQRELRADREEQKQGLRPEQ
jgi:hypothetical protein